PSCHDPDQSTSRATIPGAKALDYAPRLSAGLTGPPTSWHHLHTVVIRNRPFGLELLDGERVQWGWHEAGTKACRARARCHVANPARSVLCGRCEDDRQSDAWRRGACPGRADRDPHRRRLSDVADPRVRRALPRVPDRPRADPP